MKIRVIGPESEVNAFIEEVSKSNQVVERSEPQPSGEIPSWIRVYFEIPSALQNIVNNISEHQILEYCQAWKSKSDVMHFFKISFGEAEEILERMHSTGVLDRDLFGSSRRNQHYEYKVHQPDRCCANCEHYLSTGECDYHRVTVCEDRSCLFFKPYKLKRGEVE